MKVFFVIVLFCFSMQLIGRDLSNNYSIDSNPISGMDEVKEAGSVKKKYKKLWLFVNGGS